MSDTFGQSDIQSLINAGYGYAAEVLGSPFDVHRPSGTASPLAQPILRTMLAKFDARPDFSHRAPSSYGKPVVYLLADATGLLPGDYFTDGARTYFLAGQEPNVPPMCVECNTVVDVTRGATQAQDGLNTIYAGRTDASDTALMQHWPASVLEGGRTEAGQVDLPADPRMTGVFVLLPAVPGLLIRTSDRIVDDQGRAHTVGSAELTSLGWRLRAVSAAT